MRAVTWPKPPVERVCLVMAVLGGLVAIAALLFPDLRRARAPVAAGPIVRPG